MLTERDLLETIISIHAPRVGSDVPLRPRRLERKLFQSTLPVWGATSFFTSSITLFAISIHAPRVGSDTGQLIDTVHIANFNPRSPCGERLFTSEIYISESKFQSTLPVWGATPCAGRY